MTAGHGTARHRVRSHPRQIEQKITDFAPIFAKLSFCSRPMNMYSDIEDASKNLGEVNMGHFLPVVQVLASNSVSFYYF